MEGIMSDQNKGGSKSGANPEIEGPDAERRAGHDAEVAKRLPGYTPQGRTGDEKEDVAEKTPGFTPQGRTGS
jgi:hypothetical protein